MRYKCQMCGQIYDEKAEGVAFADLPEDWVCPACGAPKSLFEVMEEVSAAGPEAAPVTAEDETAAYIKQLAVSGESPISAGPTTKPLPKWDEVLWLAGQVATPPLLDDAEVVTKTVIGKRAKRPMELAMPIFVSHMSFGALSGETKTALAKGAAAAGTAIGSGEGGMYEPEFAAAEKYIFEYVPNLYSVTDENLSQADAIEIKIGQSAKPGLGGHLPAARVTEEVAKLRGKPLGQDIISPARFERLTEPEGLKKLVAELRERSGGRPIGVKIAANHIEADLARIMEAGADFVTLDGRGGSTGAAPVSLKDAAGVPTLYALVRASKFLREREAEMELVITGGLRLPSEMAKALALGADVVAVATATLVALTAAEGAPEQKVANFLTAANKELKMFARVAGKDDLAKLAPEDVVAGSLEVAGHTGLRLA